jgi:hypothetical protein
LRLFPNSAFSRKNGRMPNTPSRREGFFRAD